MASSSAGPNSQQQSVIPGGPGELTLLSITADHGDRILRSIFGETEIAFVTLPGSDMATFSVIDHFGKEHIFFVTAARSVGGKYHASLVLRNTSPQHDFRMVGDNINALTGQLNALFSSVVKDPLTVVMGGVVSLESCVMVHTPATSAIAALDVSIRVPIAPHWEQSASSAQTTKGMTFRLPMTRSGTDVCAHVRVGSNWYRVNGTAPSAVSAAIFKFVDSVYAAWCSGSYLTMTLPAGVESINEREVCWPSLPAFHIALHAAAMECKQTLLKPAPLVVPDAQPIIGAPTVCVPAPSSSASAIETKAPASTSSVARVAEIIFDQVRSAAAAGPERSTSVATSGALDSWIEQQVCREGIRAQVTDAYADHLVSGDQPQLSRDVPLNTRLAFVEPGTDSTVFFTAHELRGNLARLMCNPFMSDGDTLLIGVSNASLRAHGTSDVSKVDGDVVRMYVRMSGGPGVHLYGWRGTPAQAQLLSYTFTRLFGKDVGIHVWSTRAEGEQRCLFNGLSFVTSIHHLALESRHHEYYSRPAGKRGSVVVIERNHATTELKHHLALKANKNRLARQLPEWSILLTTASELNAQLETFELDARLTDPANSYACLTIVEEFKARQSANASQYLTELLDPIGPCDSTSRYQLPTSGDFASDYLPSVPLCQSAIARLGLSLAAPKPIVVSIYPDGVECAVLAVPSGYSSFAIPIPCNFIVLPEYKTPVIQGGGATVQRASVNISSNLLNVSSTMYFGLTRSPFANISGPLNSPDDLPTIAIGSVVPGITMQVGADVHYPAAALGPGYVCNTLGQVASGLNGVINTASSNVSIFANTASVGGSGITSGSELGSSTLFQGIRLSHQINAYSSRTFCPANMFTGVAGAGNFTIAQVQAAADLACTAGTPCKMTFAGVRGPVNFNGFVKLFAGAGPMTLNSAVNSWYGVVFIVSLTTDPVTQAQTSNTYSFPADLSMNFGSGANVQALTVSWNQDLRVQGAIVDIRVAAVSGGGLITTSGGLVTQWSSEFNMVPLVKPSPVPMLIIGGLPNSAANVTELVVSYKMTGRVTPLQSASQILGVPSAGTVTPHQHEVKAMIMDGIAGGYCMLSTRGLNSPGAPAGSFALLSSSGAEERGLARMLAHQASRDRLSDLVSAKALASADGVPEHLVDCAASGMGDFVSAAAGIASMLPGIGPALSSLLGGLARSGVASASGHGPRRRRPRVPAWPTDAAMSVTAPTLANTPRRRGAGTASGKASTDLIAVSNSNGNARASCSASGGPPNHQAMLTRLMASLHTSPAPTSDSSAAQLFAQWLMQDPSLRQVVMSGIEEQADDTPEEYQRFLSAVAHDVWRPNDGVRVTLLYFGDADEDLDFTLTSAGPAHVFKASEYGIPVGHDWPTGDFTYRHGHNEHGHDDADLDSLEPVNITETRGSASAAGKFVRQHATPMLDRLYAGFVEVRESGKDECFLTGHLRDLSPTGRPARYRFPVLSSDFSALCDVAASSTPDGATQYVTTPGGNYVNINQEAFMYNADIAGFAIDTVGIYFTVRVNPRVSGLNGASAGAAMLAAVYGLRNDIVYTGGLVTSRDESTSEYVVSDYLFIEHDDLVAKLKVSRAANADLVYLHDLTESVPPDVLCWCPDERAAASCTHGRSNRKRPNKRASEPEPASTSSAAAPSAAGTSAAANAKAPWLVPKGTRPAEAKVEAAKMEPQIQGWLINPAAALGQLKKLFNDTVTYTERRAGTEEAPREVRVSEMMSILDTFRTRFDSWVMTDARRASHKYLLPQ